MPPEVRLEGYIASYNKERGFGFIKADGLEQPLFFHYSFLEGEEEGAIYQKLYSGEDLKTLRVSFTTNSDERGLRAKQIRLVSEFSEIEEFIKSPNATGSEAIDQFFSIATLPAISFIESDEGLTRLTVQRIIRSPEKWGELTSLAKEWVEAIQNLKFASLTVSPGQFPTMLVKLLKMVPDGQPEIDSTIPCVIQFVERIDCPLRIFREAQNHSIIVLPNVDALQRALKKNQGSLIVSSRDILRLVVLLDESGVVNATIKTYQEHRIILIRQSTIMKVILGSDDDYPVIMGRNLRKALPIEKLQPYQVGSEYDSSIFSGRLRERERILEDASGNYAIYGGRKIGKTWFLKDICNACRGKTQYSSIYIPYYVSLPRFFTGTPIPAAGSPSPSPPTKRKAPASRPPPTPAQPMPAADSRPFASTKISASGIATGMRASKRPCSRSALGCPMRASPSRGSTLAQPAAEPTSARA